MLLSRIYCSEKMSRFLTLMFVVTFWNNYASALISVPSSVNVTTGSSDGSPVDLQTAGEGKVVNLYSDNNGKLTAVITIPASSFSAPPVLKARFLQKTSGDIFTFQILLTSGKYASVGSTSGQAGSYKNLTYQLPANSIISGAVTIRLSAGVNSNASVDDSALDYMALSSGAPVPVPVPNPVPVPVPAPLPGPVGNITLPPAGKILWDWQIGASTDANITLPAGVRLMDLDGFNTSAAEVASLKAQGIYTVCYIDAGSYEDGRPDAGLFPSYLKIYYDSAWGEWFLDVTDVFKPNSALASILNARLKMCKDKGFDALEPDNLQNDENAGGKITLQQQIDFNGWIADAAHAAGLAVFQKNGPSKILNIDRTGKMMVEKFDGILNEQCQQYNECGPLAEYSKRGKLALNVEYSGTLNCSLSNSLVINSIRKGLSLTGGNQAGYLLQSCK